MNTRGILGYFVLGILIGLGLYALADGPDEQRAELEQYCDMVHLHRLEPDKGWPDFNHNYDEVCKDGRYAPR